MPSTSKTPLLGLNQWVRSDGVSMDDFNADNAVIDARLGTVPLVKLKEIVISATAQSVEIDLSDIDMTQYAELWIDVRLGVGYSGGNQVYLRLNNLSTSVYSYTYASGGNCYANTTTLYNLYTGLHKFSLGTTISWTSPNYLGMGGIPESALTPSAWTSITFFRTIGTIPAGGKIGVYGVKLL